MALILSQQFSFLASYTLSKTLDDVSSFNITGSAAPSTAGENDLAQNPFDLGAERVVRSSMLGTALC